MCRIQTGLPQLRGLGLCSPYLQGGAPGTQSWLLLGGGFGSEMMRAVQDGEEKVVGAGRSGHMGTTAIIPWPGVEGPLPTE